MKGLAFRKLGRTSSHRRALLRNLITSLFEHQRISTTVAKAKDAQRMAEKVITKAKRGFLQERKQQRKAVAATIFNGNATLPRLRELAERYKDRQGGYTRLHLHGNRVGDNAPRALLELVDQPQGDLKLEMTAMAMGRELYLRSIRSKSNSVVQDEVSALNSLTVETDERFEELTRINAAKVVRFGGDEARRLLAEKARDQYYRLMAKHELQGEYRIDDSKIKRLDFNKPRGNSGGFTAPMIGQKRLAGVRRDVLQTGPLEPEPRYRGGRNSVIRIGKGAFARRPGGRRVRFESAVKMMSSRSPGKEVAKELS